MVRSTKSPGSQDLVGRISDTIANHPHLSAAAAFQMGVLLGQAMQNSGALKGISRKVAAAQGVLASRLPTFGLFETAGTGKSSARAAARQDAAKRSRTRGAKRRKQRAHA